MSEFPILISDVVFRARFQLQDLRDQNDNPLVGLFRWTDEELALYAKDGMTEVAFYKPSATARMVEFTCVAGTLQDMSGMTSPTVGRLLNIVSYSASGHPRRPLRAAMRDDMDRMRPDWHGPGQGQPKNFVYDERNPMFFWLYPGATPGATLSILVSAVPESTSTHLLIERTHVVAVTNYILFRALTRDIDENAYVRGEMFYDAFAASVGVQRQSKFAFSPNMAVTQRQAVSEGGM